MNRAQAKRRAAIAALDGSVVARSFPTTTGSDAITDWVWHTRHARTVATLIRALARLGNAPDWRVAIESWATMTEARAEDPSGFELAYLLGSRRAKSVA